MTSLEYSRFVREIISYAESFSMGKGAKDLVTSAHLCALGYMMLSVGACDLRILGMRHAKALADELDKMVDRITPELKKDKGGDDYEA